MTHPAVQRWLETHALVEPSLLEGAGFEALVAERLSAFGGSEPAFLAELARSPEEVERLIAGIAVPETWLFRYPRSYDLLQKFLERRLAIGGPSLRMLSVGCATGQEPYCMAMTALHAGWPADRLSVEGIDRNPGFLRAAAAGKYGVGSIRTEIPSWAIRFLGRADDMIAVDSAVKAVVHFRRLDITDPAALQGSGPFDVVFCRNVLIYLNAAAREQLLGAIGAELSPGGMLFVGHAEQIIRGRLPLRPVNAPHAFALERFNGPSPATEPLPTARTLPLPPRPNPSAAAMPPAQTRYQSRPAPEDSIEEARELADSGRTEDGEFMIRAIIARRGPSAPAMELLGMIRMSVNDVPGAKRLFEQAVYLEPARSTSLLQLALLSERSGDADRAATYWDRARRASAAGGPGSRS